MTAADILKRSMRVAQILRPTHTPSASEYADALTALNGMLDTHNVEPWMAYTLSRDEYHLTANVQDYTIGVTTPASDFPVARPSRIEKFGIIDITDALHPLESEPKIPLTPQQWGQIGDKALTSTLPSEMYDDGKYPARTLWFWPIPTVAVDVALYTWNLASQIATTATIVAFPPGYTDALVYGLAVKLDMEWPKENRPALDMKVVLEAQRLKAVLNAMNAPVIEAHLDPALAGARYYDIGNDE